MRIKDKVQLNYDGLVKYGPINIVAFGDSVTHGAVGAGEIDYETVYWNRLRKKILDVRNYIPVNAINAGIGGITARASLDRIHRDVLDHNPDLIIVCFGLNDVNGSLEDYLNSLRIIFDTCRGDERDVIFMTPNMLNTRVADDTEEIYRNYAAVTADYQNNGRMDLYMQKACELAAASGVKVCDCYSVWKEISKTEDITNLLANRINHPTREMHELFAQMLFDLLFDVPDEKHTGADHTMYRG